MIDDRLFLMKPFFVFITSRSSNLIICIISHLNPLTFVLRPLSFVLYHVSYLPEGQTWFSGDNVVGGKNLFVCVRLCGSVANHLPPTLGTSAHFRHFQLYPLIYNQ